MLMIVVMVMAWMFIAPLFNSWNDIDDNDDDSDDDNDGLVVHCAPV